MRGLAITAIATLLTAGAAAAQTAPSEWRRTDMSETTPGATAFVATSGDIHLATVVIRAPVDRPLGLEGGVFRGAAFHTRIDCGRRMWNIQGVTYYAADFSIVREDGEVSEAPLVRETPLHAAITDVCDGGHTGPVGLTTTDVVAVQRWLDER